MMFTLLRCEIIILVVPLWTSKYLQCQNHWLSFPTTSIIMYFGIATHSTSRHNLVKQPSQLHLVLQEITKTNFWTLLCWTYFGHGNLVYMKFY
jgi:hypothetical protein